MANKKKPKETYPLEVVNVRLVKEPSILSEEPVLTSDTAVELVKNFLKDFDREAFCILNIATDGKPISMNLVTIGTLNSTMVSPRDVMKSTILSNAAAFIAFHCHPSGNPRPSMEDATITQRLKDAAEIMEVRMLDHIIVGCGTDKFFSFEAEGMLNEKNVITSYHRSFGKDEWER